LFNPGDDKSQNFRKQNIFKKNRPERPKFSPRNNFNQALQETTLNPSDLYFKYSGSDECHPLQVEKQYGLYKKLIKIYSKYSNEKEPCTNNLMFQCVKNKYEYVSLHILK
jgi:hypothetical protein